MAVVDSKKKLFSSIEIIAQGAMAMGADPQSKKAMMTQAGLDASAPNTNIVQAGNTVFVSHPNKKQDAMIGLIYNVDTPNNYARNVAKFFRYLRKSGVTRYVARFQDRLTLNVFEALKKVTATNGVRMDITQDKQRQLYVAFVVLPKKGS